MCQCINITTSYRGYVTYTSFKVDVVFINGSPTKQNCQGNPSQLKEGEKRNSIYYRASYLYLFYIYWLI